MDHADWNKLYIGLHNYIHTHTYTRMHYKIAYSYQESGKIVYLKQTNIYVNLQKNAEFFQRCRKIV